MSSDLLRNKVSLITGSNRGIGKTITELFAKNGSDIIACARKETPDFSNFLEYLSHEYQVKVKALYFDLTNEEQTKTALKEVVSAGNRIDVLVNNAGVAHGNLFHMTSINKIREVFEINFFSQLLITQIVSKLMIRQQSGSIVNLSSIAGLDGYPGYIAYGSSKAAVNYATKTLSQELAKYNVRINAVAPGLTETEMADQMENKARDKMVGNSAMNRLASTIEIANTVLYLSSDLSSFVNGQILRVDGGKI